MLRQRGAASRNAGSSILDLPSIYRKIPGLGLCPGEGALPVVHSG
jgi:hypothetical protein